MALLFFAVLIIPFRRDGGCSKAGSPSSPRAREPTRNLDPQLNESLFLIIAVIYRVATVDPLVSGCLDVVVIQIQS
ncbi:hypothetical protein FE257_000366 [Aspergillus nanangensis]|uniref:Uncharacterized protein n=1 Tax=Aspergillus nanangensis TaxID=2582783 RepID=A0AAD4CUM4_ASPNN|nr:hypothetical protein FE257_000366 [Aspergillus nanangensis]